MMPQRPPSGAELKVDRVTAAILGMRDIDIGTILGSYEPMNGKGPGYETNVPGLVMRDEFGAPDLVVHPDGGFATTNTYWTSDAVSLHGPAQERDGGITDPLVMVNGHNLSETLLGAAPGRTLAEVVDISRTPALSALARAVITSVVNGDARPGGGIAFCHIHLDPAWRTTTIPDYN